MRYITVNTHPEAMYFALKMTNFLKKPRLSIDS